MVENPLFGPVPHYVWPRQPVQNPYEFQQSFASNTHQGQDRNRYWGRTASPELDERFEDLSLNQENGASRRGTRRYSESGDTRTTEHGRDIPAGVPSYAAGRPRHVSRNFYQSRSERRRSESQSENRNPANSATLPPPLTRRRPLRTPANTSSGNANNSDASVHSHDSDEDDSHNQTLVVNRDGRFRLGPQWRVPDFETAQDLAGCGTENVIIKSLQDSEQHGTYFTLTEEVHNFDLSISGGLSVGSKAVPASPGYSGCGTCSLPCFNGGDSPTFSDVDLPPNPLHRETASSRSCGSLGVPERLTSPNPSYVTTSAKTRGPNNGMYTSSHPSPIGTSSGTRRRVATGRERGPTRPTSPKRNNTQKKSVSFALTDSGDGTNNRKKPRARVFDNTPASRERTSKRDDDPYVQDNAAQRLRRMNRFNRGSVFRDTTNHQE